MVFKNLQRTSRLRPGRLAHTHNARAGGESHAMDEGTDGWRVVQSVTSNRTIEENRAGAGARGGRMCERARRGCYEDALNTKLVPV